jgi:HK97 gp10 family phage protein
MRTVHLDLAGHEDLDRAFRRLEGGAQRKVTARAMRSAWRAVHAKVIAKAPVKSGRMKAGIKLRAVQGKRGVFGVRVVVPTREQLGLPEGTKGYYPASVEFGRRTKSGGRVGARPFLRPAHDEGKEEALQTFRVELGVGLAGTWGAA